MQQIQRAFLFIIVIVLGSSCGDGNPASTYTKDEKSNAPLEPRDFERKNEFFSLLEDLNIDVSYLDAIVFIPPTNCVNCKSKALNGIDLLANTGTKSIMVLHAEINNELCHNIRGKYSKVDCTVYRESLIESKYGFYYWDPIVFELKDGELINYDLL